MNENQAFLGTGWAFPPRFTSKGNGLGARMVSGEDDVQEALTILFSTAPGERVMHPTYGSALRRMVFEPLNTGATTEIKDHVRRAVLFHEPRITLESVDVTVVDGLEGVVRISLDYTIRGTNTRSNMVFPFYLTEGTNLRHEP